MRVEEVASKVLMLRNKSMSTLDSTWCSLPNRITTPQFDRIIIIRQQASTTAATRWPSGAASLHDRWQPVPSVIWRCFRYHQVRRHPVDPGSRISGNPSLTRILSRATEQIRMTGVIVGDLGGSGLIGSVAVNGLHAENRLLLFSTHSIIELLRPSLREFDPGPNHFYGKFTVSRNWKAGHLPWKPPAQAHEHGAGVATALQRTR
mgnify:CR=1 FL=1